jgi:hypothetical protein
MYATNVLPLPAAPLWAVRLARPNLRVGPYPDRDAAARMLRRLLASHPDWKGRVAPWDDGRR